ncbi:acetate--CoA ligase family protein [Paucidesulfovibrio longus]|uniref:acetate--CoA ligase family protein n=1 Tax=Paucidesulfovibrio longus TaxID=889 RepID=UPI00040297A6|nr:acetate--CoA ligase [Paucidesulfovibrio longus]
MLPIKNADALFAPRSVIVAGASANPEKAGHKVLANLLRSGYKGRIIPVNPSGGEILGLEALPASEVPEGVDLAVLCVPREKTPDVLAELAARKIRAAVVMASGFKETGREGYYLEEQLASIARRHDIALVGPNSLGLANPVDGLYALPTPNLPGPGNVAFFSQSGSLCFGLLDWAEGMDIGFSKFVPLGNKAVFNEVHALEYFLHDPDTAVVLGHLESLDFGQEFMRAAEALTAEKPVIMLKAGVSPAGARAVSSHTGAVAGKREAYEAAFIQSGIISTRDVRSLFTLSEAFSTQPLPKGPNLVVVTNSGGPGILTADACEHSRLNLVRPSQAALEKLREALPPYASLYNPIDIIGDAGADRYRQTLAAVLEDPATHAVLVLLTPTASAEIVPTAQAIADVAKDCGKPVFACFMGEERIAPGRELLRKAGFPCYGFPEQAVYALDAMYGHWLWRNRAYPVDVCFRRDKARAERLIDQCRETGITELSGFKAQEFGAAYELPFPETKLSRTSDHAVKHAKKIGYPVAMKIASPHIPDKADVDGVILGIETPREVRRAFLELTARAARRRPDAYIVGCQVQSMAPKGSRDVRVGFVRDSQFGALITFSMGGVHSEVLGDVAFRLAPLSLGDTQNIVKEIKAFPLLRGVRGQESVDIGAIEDILLTVSQMAVDFPEIEEADIGPILVYNKGALVVDMRLTLSAARKNGR